MQVSLVRARILLKADASETGEGWSDSQIATALDTSVTDGRFRTRQQLVEEGFDVRPDLQAFAPFFGQDSVSSMEQARPSSSPLPVPTHQRGAFCWTLKRP